MQFLAAALSLVSLAAANPIAANVYTEALRNLPRQNIGDAELDNLAYYSEHATAAYCNSFENAGARVTCGGDCPTLENNGVTIVGSFDGFWTGIASYVAVDEQRQNIVLSVRGSANVRNWISNLQFAKVGSDLTGGAEVHEGFNKAWNEMRGGVSNAINEAKGRHPGYKIVSVGHSLGGAVATIAGATLRNEGHDVEIVSFGAPRVGNDVAADYITNQNGAEWRLTHANDPVPRLPPIIFGYRHTSPEYWLRTRGNGPDYPLGDIQVCPGNANIGCNGGSFGLSILAHLEYLGNMAGCVFGLFGGEMTANDEELEQRLDGWVQDDIDYVNGN